MYKVQLLVAVCRHANNQMLPIILAVIEVDNQFTWTWFLELVNDDLDLREGHQLSIITDAQKVIILDLEE